MIFAWVYTSATDWIGLELYISYSQDATENCMNSCFYFSPYIHHLLTKTCLLTLRNLSDRLSHSLLLNVPTFQIHVHIASYCNRRCIEPYARIRISFRKACLQHESGVSNDGNHQSSYLERSLSETKYYTIPK